VEEAMSPRKSRQKIPEYIAQSIRKKRNQLLHGPYNCPKCWLDKLRIQVDKERKEVLAICSCGLEHSLNYVQSFEAVDYFNKLIDGLNRK
jgi:transcription elongation factor Elf1